MSDEILDVDRFYGIMARLPWHADTLLQLSEVFRHQEGTFESLRGAPVS